MQLAVPVPPSQPVAIPAATKWEAAASRSALPGAWFQTKPPAPAAVPRWYARPPAGGLLQLEKDSGNSWSQLHGLTGGSPPTLSDGLGESSAIAWPERLGSSAANFAVSIMCHIPWRMLIPAVELPKFILTPQKLEASMNWTSKLPAWLMLDVMRKLGLVVNGPVRSGVRGQSVKSMLGEEVCMLVNSLDSSVKIVAWNVSSAAPAGTQYSLQ